MCLLIAFAENITLGLTRFFFPQKRKLTRYSLEMGHMKRVVIRVNTDYYRVKPCRLYYRETDIDSPGVKN